MTNFSPSMRTAVANSAVKNCITCSSLLRKAWHAFAKLIHVVFLPTFSSTMGNVGMSSVGALTSIAVPLALGLSKCSLLYGSVARIFKNFMVRLVSCLTLGYPHICLYHFLYPHGSIRGIGMDYGCGNGGLRLFGTTASDVVPTLAVWLVPLDVSPSQHSRLPSFRPVWWPSLERAPSVHSVHIALTLVVCSESRPMRCQS